MSETNEGNLLSNTIKLSELKKYVRVHFKSKRSIFIWGPPGIGKSDAVKQIGKDFHTIDGKTCFVIDCRLTLWDATDLKGYPYFDRDANKMRFSIPDELPDEEMSKKYDYIILFLDELNGASPSTMAAAYQLILDRAIGKYKLPDNVFIIAAGNRDDDRGVTYRMPKPLSNRFVHYEVKEDFDDWMDWAILNEIHPNVVGYIANNKQSLFRFEPKSAEYSFPTPRSWTYVSEMLKEVDKENWSDSDILQMVRGSVGSGEATVYTAYMEMAGRLPNPSAILNGDIKTFNEKDNNKGADGKTIKVSAKFSLIISLCYELRLSHEKEDGDEFYRKFDNFIQFGLDNFDSEMAMMSFHTLVNRYMIKVDVRRSKNFIDFVTRFEDIIEYDEGN